MTPVAPDPDRDAEAQLRLRHRGARVLLAADNPIEGEVTLEFLQAAGLTVDVAEDGPAAVAMAQGTRYDLVLLDAQMPGMDAPDATRAIRARPELAQIPILAMSAGDFDGERDACIAAGMNGVIAKPVDPPALYAALLSQLDAARRRVAVSGAEAAQPAYARIQAVPGLDVAQGLKYVGGKWPLYTSLLEMLVQDNQTDVERLRAHLAAGDSGSAMRIAHSLKSTSATLGAEELRQRAAAVEQAIRADPGNAGYIEPLCAALEAELTRLCAALRPCLDALPRPSSG